MSHILKQYHANKINLGDKALDRLLGIEEKPETDQLLQDKYKDEQLEYEGTPYSFIRHFLHLIEPQKTDVIYDLGSGYGRVVIYGALVTEATFKGIEILPERFANCVKAKKKLNLANAFFILNTAQDCDFSDGNIFFLFNPFSDKTLSYVGNKLKEISLKKGIRIVTWGGPSNYYFLSQSWLHEDKPNQSRFSRLQFFRS